MVFWAIVQRLKNKLLETHKVITLKKKVGRGVPVIIPNDTEHGLIYLTYPNVRLSAGIEPGNEDIFALQGEGLLWAYDSLKRAVNKPIYRTH